MLDSDNVLKIIIFPYSVTFLNSHKFKTFCMLVILFTFVFVFVTFDKKICTPKIFIVSAVILIV